MRTPLLLLLGVLAASAPADLATAKGTSSSGSSGICPLHCPSGYAVVHYGWSVKVEKIIYDDAGQAQIPPDAPWHVSCTLRCELRVLNQETKVATDSKAVCDSGGEPKPYHGPWRITGPFTRECNAIDPDGCGLKCHPIRAPKPPRKGGRKK